MQCMRPFVALSTSRCQVLSLNANTAFDILGESIGKACLCPSFQHTHFALTSGIFGCPGKKSQSSQRSRTNKLHLNNPLPTKRNKKTKTSPKRPLTDPQQKDITKKLTSSKFYYLPKDFSLHPTENRLRSE